MKTHVADIFQRLGVSHRTDVVTKAMSQSIIKLQSFQSTSTESNLF